MDIANLSVQQGNTVITPEDARYHRPTLEQIDCHLARLIAADKLQCASYLISRQGKIFAHRAMGPLRGFAPAGTLQPDSIRPIASITKIFTAIAVLQLIERGALYLTQPVMQIIPEFNTPMHQGITLFHLLTHTSGLMADPGYFREPYLRDWPGKNDHWILEGLSGPVQAKLGKAWNYSSVGYLFLGEIVSRVSGMPYEQYVTDNIIRPLGMTRTGFDVPSDYRSQVCMVTEGEQRRLADNASRNGRPPRSAGGLYSSLYDLWLLGQTMLERGTFNGQRILGRKTVEQMTSNNLPDGIPAFHWGDRYPAYQQGLGWRVTSRNLFGSPGTFGHEGAGRCSLYIDPAEQLVAAIFVPSRIDFVPESIIGLQGMIWSGIL